MCGGKYCIFDNHNTICDLSNSDIKKNKPIECPYYHAYPNHNIEFERELDTILKE